MYIFSKKGTFHQATGSACQDVIKSADFGSWQIIAMADGVSSEEYSGTGSNLACSEALNYLHWQHEKIGFLPQSWSQNMLNHITSVITEHATANNRKATDYACTLMVLVFERERKIMHCFNIGDGLLLGIGEDNKCRVLVKPQDDSLGCPTIFTENIKTAIDLKHFCTSNIKCLLLCTDGAWKSMYKRGVMDAGIKHDLMTRDFCGFINHMKKIEPQDDCTFAILETGRAA